MSQEKAKYYDRQAQAAMRLHRATGRQHWYNAYICYSRGAINERGGRWIPSK